MAYFVHNKYDKASIDALETIGVGQTLVDFYTDYETYKYLDTSAGFGILYDELSYITPGTVINDGQADNDNSHFNFQSSIIIKSIQRGISQTAPQDVTINLSTRVDTDKTMVLVQSGAATGAGVYLQSLSPTQIVLHSAASNAPCSYQVIEYK